MVLAHNVHPELIIILHYRYAKLAVKTKDGMELNAFVSITSIELMVFVLLVQLELHLIQQLKLVNQFALELIKSLFQVHVFAFKITTESMENAVNVQFNQHIIEPLKLVFA